MFIFLAALAAAAALLSDTDDPPPEKPARRATTPPERPCPPVRPIFVREPASDDDDTPATAPDDTYGDYEIDLVWAEICEENPDLVAFGEEAHATDDDPDGKASPRAGGETAGRQRRHSSDGRPRSRSRDDQPASEPPAPLAPEAAGPQESFWRRAWRAVSAHLRPVLRGAFDWLRRNGRAVLRDIAQVLADRRRGVGRDARLDGLDLVVGFTRYA